MYNREDRKNYNTRRFQVGAKTDLVDLMDNCGVGDKAPLGGTKAEPRMFFDSEGFLHIVLRGAGEKAYIDDKTIAKDKNSGPENEPSGFKQGNGIYIHTSSSEIIDKVCPCKLLPNEICGCVS